MILRPSKEALLASATVFAFTLSATNATTILIDFGRTDNQTAVGNYNNVHGNGTAIETPMVDLIDSDGIDTGISLEVDFTSGGSWAGTQADFAGPYPADVVAEEVTALQDSMFIRDPARVTMTLAGLNVATVYDILIYGGRGNNGGANAEFTVTDNSGDTLIAFDVFGNATEVASFETMVPDAQGNLTITYTTTADGTRPRGALSFMRISEGSTTPFEIIDIDFDNDVVAPKHTITWNSRDGQAYALFYSTDCESWIEINDSIPSEGETTSFVQELLPFFAEVVGARTLFYRVALAN